MRTNANIFDKENVKGYFTKGQLKKVSECTKEYNGYTIAFGHYIKQGNRTWWRLSVYQNDGQDRFLVFRTKNLIATDSDAMFEGIQWAKANIDELNK